MNENTYALDLNGKAVIDIDRYEALFESETQVNILKEYFSRNRYISEEVARFILGIPEPPKEDAKSE